MYSENMGTLHRKWYFHGRWIRWWTNRATGLHSPVNQQFRFHITKSMVLLKISLLYIFVSRWIVISHRNFLRKPLWSFLKPLKIYSRITINHSMKARYTFFLLHFDLREWVSLFFGFANFIYFLNFQFLFFLKQ